MYVAPAHFIAGWLMSTNLGVSFNPITQIGGLWLMYFFAPFSFFYFLYSRKKKNSSEQPLRRQTATSVTKSMNTEPDIEFYEQALAELDSGGRDTGIWAKAYAEGADEEHSRKLYVKGRAAQLMSKQTGSTASEVSVEKEVPYVSPRPRYYLFKIYVAVIALILLLIFSGLQQSKNSGQVVTFNSIACPAGYAPTF
jgi:hypothetical protein